MTEQNQPREIHPISSFKFDEGVKDFSPRPVLDSEDVALEAIDPKKEFARESVDSLGDALRHPTLLDLLPPEPENPATMLVPEEENGSNNELTAVTELPESPKDESSTPASSSETKSGKSVPPAPVVPPTSGKTRKP